MIRSYINLLRHWLWLLVLTTLAGALIAYAVSQRAPTQYTATARLMVGPATTSANPELNALRAAQQLLEVYASLPNNRPFQEDVIDDLGLDITPGELDKMIAITTDSTAQRLTIRVVAEDRDLATRLANSVANLLVAQSPAASRDPEANSRLLEQIDRLEAVLARSDARIVDLESRRESALTSEARAEVENQISQERSYQAEVERLLVSLYADLQETPINRVVVVEPAIEGKLVERELGLKTVLGALAGLVLGATIMFAAEYFNNTLRGANEVSAATDAPVLGVITTHRSAHAAAQDLLTVLARPNSAAADRFQRIGMHLQYAAIRDALHSLLVADVSKNVAAGEAAANLAIVLARLGSNVVLVDADAQDAVITHQFSLAERAGLTDYLIGDEVDINRLVLKVADLPHLSVLPFGLARGDRFGLVTSPRLQDALTQLRAASDLVIIAGPPLLQNAGGFVLGSRVTRTLVIVASGQDNREQLREVVDELEAVGAGILGVLLAEPSRRPTGGLPFTRQPHPTAVMVDSTLTGARSPAHKSVRS